MYAFIIYNLEPRVLGSLSPSILHQTWRHSASVNIPEAAILIRTTNLYHLSSLAMRSEVPTATEIVCTAFEGRRQDKSQTSLVEDGPRRKYLDRLPTHPHMAAHLAVTKIPANTYFNYHFRRRHSDQNFFICRNLEKQSTDYGKAHIQF